MSRIKKVFDTLQAQHRKGLIAYLTVGCPDCETTLKAVLELEKAGADMIELGIPFSDPMADGPVIQKAAIQALKNGVTTAKTLELVGEIRRRSAIPLLTMNYVNTVLNFGPRRFVEEFSAAGADGVIIPDLPVEESGILQPVCREHRFDLIQFVAPTTTSDRIKAICGKASGFVYCISNTGVTGVRKVDYNDIGSVVKTVRSQTSVPAAIGFGIGSAATARAAARCADAVILGSAVMSKLMDAGVEEAGRLIGTIRQALDEGV